MEDSGTNGTRGKPERSAPSPDLGRRLNGESQADHYESCVALARVCGTPIRLEILAVLASGPANVTAIAASLKLDIAHVSHHLASLREADLVAVRRDGKRRIYELGRRAEACPATGRVVLRLEADDGAATFAVHLPGRLIDDQGQGAA